MATMVVETNWVTTVSQIFAMIMLLVSFWIAWQAYRYQKMESVQKADKQIAQNDVMIGLLEKINKKLDK